MNTPSEEPTQYAQVTRRAELEQEKSSLHEELTKGRKGRSSTSEGKEQARLQPGTRSQRSSRRKMLTKGLGVAAVASVGAGALLELSDGTAQAASDKPGVFGSQTAGTPAVSATGTNGADGVDASSDSGKGVSATSRSGTALVATTSTGLAAQFSGGDVTMDRTLNVGINLNVTGEVSGHILTGQTTNDTAIFGKDDGVGNGVQGSSNSGIGVSAESTTGVGLRADALTSGTAVLGTTPNGNAIWGRNLGSGLAGKFDGNVQVNGSFSATGVKNFVQAHPSDPSRDIVYAALEGGVAAVSSRAAKPRLRCRSISGSSPLPKA